MTKYHLCFHAIFFFIAIAYKPPQTYAFQTASTLSTRIPSFPHSIDSLNIGSKPSDKDWKVRRSNIYTRLHLSSSTSTKSDKEIVDTSALLKYVISAGVEISLLSAILAAIDKLLCTLDVASLPQPATWFLFYALSLKSRVFNPLNNDRPNITKEKEGSAGFRDRIMPKWTPPGVVFPIMWLLIIAPLRATSSTIVVAATESYFHPSILCLMLHLTIGDIWNTINNTEKRYGTSVIGVIGVWLSATFAATQYFEVDPLAGKLLGATCIWLTVASALIIQTWRLNVRADGKKDAFLPKIKEGEMSVTSFDWFD